MVLLRNIHFIRHKACQSGFTLVEFMIVIALSGIVIAAVYSTYTAQQKSYIVQDQVVEMQQNIRAALDLMEREIRMAGYNPQMVNIVPPIGVSYASAGRVSFSFDINDNNTVDDDGNGRDDEPDGDVNDPGEMIDYGFTATALTDDTNRDGLPDGGGVLPLGRQLDNAGGYQPIADNIEAIGFAYAYDSNSDGQLDVNAISNISWAIPDNTGGWIDLDTDNDGDIDVNDAAPAPVTGLANATQLGQIRAVQIWILARAGRADPDYVNPNAYKVGANVIPAANDNFRRRLLSVNVKCRNMGLQ